RIRPHVAAVEKKHAAKVPVKHGAELLAECEHAVASDGEPGSAQRTHLVAAPATNARRAAKEIFLRERNDDPVVAGWIDVAGLEPAGNDHAVTQGQIVTAVDRYRVVDERAGEDLPCLLGVKRELIAARRVQQVVSGAG